MSPLWPTIAPLISLSCPHCWPFHLHLDYLPCFLLLEHDNNTLAKQPVRTSKWITKCSDMHLHVNRTILSIPLNVTGLLYWPQLHYGPHHPLLQDTFTWQHMTYTNKTIQFSHVLFAQKNHRILYMQVFHLAIGLHIIVYFQMPNSIRLSWVSA